jgi:hypothetical protein
MFGCKFTNRVLELFGPGLLCNRHPLHFLISVIHTRTERVAQDARVKELLQVLQAVEVALPSDAEEQAEC